MLTKNSDFFKCVIAIPVSGNLKYECIFIIRLYSLIRLAPFSSLDAVLQKFTNVTKVNTKCNENDRIIRGSLAAVQIYSLLAILIYC